MPRWKAYLQLARISNSPTVVSNILAGLILAGPISWDSRWVALTLGAFLFYTAGMFLNDVCDTSIDAKERPERPIPSGVVSRAEAFLLTILFFGMGVGLTWWVSFKSFLASLALVSLIVLYDVWHKSNPISPLFMGLCRGAVYVVAFASVTWPPSIKFWYAASAIVLYILSLTWIARSESNFQLRSIAPAVLPFLPVAYFLWVGNLSILVMGSASIYVLWTLYSLRFVYRLSSRNIGQAIGHLIAGVSLLDAMVLASQGTQPGVLVAFGCFGLTLFFQRFIKGT